MIFVTPAILSTIKQDPLSSFAMKTLSSSGVDLFRPNNLCDLGTYSIFTGHISDPWARLVSRNKNLWLHLPAHTHHHLGGWGGGDVNRVRKHHQFIPEAEARIAEVMHVSVTVGCHQSCTDRCVWMETSVMNNQNEGGIWPLFCNKLQHWSYHLSFTGLEIAQSLQLLLKKQAWAQRPFLGGL